MAILSAMLVSSAKNFVKQKVGGLINGIEFIRKTEVAVGIPHDKDAAHEGGLTNAELLYIQCNGSEAAHIPPRNVLNGVKSEESGNAIGQLLKDGMKEALKGNIDGARANYEKAGMVGQAAVRKQFGVIPPPNAPATIAKKGSSATLIDTGALRQAITYVVRDKT